MKEALKKLHDLQTEISSQSSPHWLFEESLMFGEMNNLLNISFFGSPYDEAYEKFLKLLLDHEICKKIKTLTFDSPDEGANGTNNFDFSILGESKISFPELISFAVKLTEPEDHNRVIIAEDKSYDEEGLIAKLIKKMPKLLSLQIPSAPNSEFFDLNSHPLEFLKVQTGYDHQNFIINLSNSNCFPNLWHFDFTDYQETYGKGWHEFCTPFEHFKEFFNSKVFDSIKVMILRNLTYSNEQIKELKSYQKEVPFKLIRTESNYVY